MSSTILAKVKILKRMLVREEKNSAYFPSLDKTLAENESYLKIQLENIEQNLKTMAQLDNDIVAVAEDDDVCYVSYLEEEIFDRLQSCLHILATKYRDQLKLIAPTIDQSQVNANSTQVVHNRSDPLNGTGVIIPPLNIEPFDGTYEDWSNFKDRFESSIYNNTNLCNSSKLQYLQSLLKGEAARVIKRSSEPLKPENFDSLWQLVKKRYEHRRSLANSYFHMLVNQKIILKETSRELANLHDTTHDALSSLNKMGLNTDEWGDLLVFLICSRLPVQTRELWEEKIGENDDLPKFETFMKFIEVRFRTLEGVEKAKALSYNNINTNKKPIPLRKTTLHTEVNAPKSSDQKCKCCQHDAHYLFKCDKFKQLTTELKVKFVKQNNYCYNCLGFHKVDTCTTASRCQKCKKKHHTMLHLESKSNSNYSRLDSSGTSSHPPVGSNVPSTSDGRFSQSNATLMTKSISAVLFPTALINVINNNGFALKFRAIIDACSDESYISERVVKKLQLQTTSRTVETCGLGGISTMSSESITSFIIQSLTQPNFSKKIKAYVLPKISSPRPNCRLEKDFLPDNIQLADPNFNIPAEIDILLGGNIDALIAMSGCIRIPEENIVVKQTQLGWIVSGGKTQSQCFAISSQEVVETMSSLDKTVRRFWEIEEPPTKRILTKEEKLAENIYEATTERLQDGKYVVSLPFKGKTETFTNMRKIAMNRFLLIEKKLNRNEQLYSEYSNCLNDYINQNHMSEIDPTLLDDAYYVPHHCVLKESSTTTKLRVVFDASAKDSNLNSLNSNLLIGPRLQDDLLDLLIRFRTYKFAFTADIQQMYRQIWINPNDRKYQCILWRPSRNSPIKTYVLNTVTFGTSSAPYLAVKTLTRLAKDERNTFPLGSNCLENGFYVDDFIHGADSVEEALQLQFETKSILESAGFNLRKWSANDQRLLDNISIEDRETKSLLSFDEKEQSIKTLGIHWAPADDSFHFEINVIDHADHTKRTLLSDIAKIFDPLGWLSPCTIIAKLLIQKLWLTQQDWDEPLSDDIKTDWLEFSKTLPYLQNIKLPRWIGTLRSIHHVELHGFSDASEMAYAAVIYVKTDDKINLLFAKTKVAPLKRLSLPRLELCAAHLLAKLMAHARDVLKIQDISYYYWSDSTITLAWIRDSPHKRTTYVANRVSEIQTLSSPACWYHVKSQENPADLGTRGILPMQLNNNQLWWHGPKFLEDIDPTKLKSSALNDIVLPEEENKKDKPKIVRKTDILESFVTCSKKPIVETVANLTKLQTNSNDLLNKFSTLSKLCRVVAYCKRVVRSNRKPHIHIAPEEYDAALLTILRMVQAESFPCEIEQLKKELPLAKASPILSLSPFYRKEDDLLRINSRIVNADHLTFDQKYPIILPRTHFVCRLIVRHAHNATMHGTQQQTLFLINQRYHIIRGSTLVKSVIHNCVKCFRFRCGSAYQQMAPLPYNRVTPIRPFLVCGVDLAGPFNLKKWKGRCNQFLKAYFAIFVCFSTKAVHLEVVVDLSSAEFIAAYRRFISRRGIPKDMYSDCGTNFVGAEGVVTRKRADYLDKWNEEMAKHMSEFHTNWHFNSPSSPHMGGLWEAGVKSAKYHLKRIVGNASLSYDEFETVLLQIEACMNSRPLTQVKDSPDTIVLSPAHFLVQAPLNALPETNFETDKLTHVDRWNYLQRLLQQFWKLWSQDYLNTLRERKKWRNSTKNVEINDVVLIRDSNIPPMAWPMGIVTEIHPGDDGLVRVVTVTSNKSSLQRPIVKLAPLPVLDF